jgi:ABC-type transport system involved in multi-copper enzyme maturation permease subunit
MYRVIASELTRLAQPRILLVWFGLMAAFALMVNAVMATVVTSASPTDLPSPGVTFPTLAEVESPSGLVAGLAAASSMFGIVTLSAWAYFTAQDYSSGLIRLLVAAEPRRWPLLAGKALALTAITALGVTVAVAANLLAAPMVGASGVSTDAWGSDIGSVLADGWLNLFLSQLVWGVLGLVMATVARSAMVAVSIGVGYVLVVESLLQMIDGAPTDRLLGATLTAIAEGGTDALSYSTALAIGLAYVAIGLTVATLVFSRRDVTD